MKKELAITMEGMMETKKDFIRKVNEGFIHYLYFNWGEEKENEPLLFHHQLMEPRIRKIIVGSSYQDHEGGQSRNIFLTVEMLGTGEKILFKVKHCLKMGGREEEIIVSNDSSQAVDKNNELIKILAEYFLGILSYNTGKGFEVWNELPE